MQNTREDIKAGYLSLIAWLVVSTAGAIIQRDGLAFAVVSVLFFAMMYFMAWASRCPPVNDLWIVTYKFRTVNEVVDHIKTTVEYVGLEAINARTGQKVKTSHAEGHKAQVNWPKVDRIWGD